jgi:acetolactate synthase-1/2/3 large subunit
MLSGSSWPTTKVFVLNNGGYLSIRNTQQNFFGRHVGAGSESGISCPDMVRVAEAYGIPARRIDVPAFGPLVEEVLSSDGPFLCEVMLDPSQGFEPRLSSKQLPDGRIVTAPLDDMFPFLDKDELASNRLVPCPEA